jgi:peptidoglycan hydrolase-like protein with peptidoglycan-binding domain
MLANPPPDGPRLNDLTRSIDGAVADWLSRTGEPPRAEVERQLGSSANGGGAVGNRLPPEAQTAAQTPPGYASLDAARGTDYVRSGESGEQVRALQEALNRAGAQPPLEVGGTFDAATEAAVRQFQQSHGCAVDGIVGPETLGAMDAALGLPRRGPPTSTPGTPSPPSTPPSEPGGQTPGVPAPGTLPPGTGGGQNGEGALSAAISQIGVREASGNNDGVPSERYSNGREVPWCANFVSWSFRQAGTPLPGNQVAIGSCDEMMRNLRSAGQYQERGSGYTPKPGDVIFFGTPGDSTHVGIVERVENGRVYTVEGNTGNRVARRDYALNEARIMGYGTT